MKKSIVTIALLVISHPCVAAGWSDLSGKNRNGDLIYITPAWEADPNSSRDYSIEANRELFYVDIYKGGKVSEQTPKTYEDLRCKFQKNKVGQDIQFSCQTSGKSPLSGATYRIVPNKNPKDCSYAAKYICIHGCDDPATPRTMNKSHWECNE